MINIEFHGAARSGYDRQVRAIISQFANFDCSLTTAAFNIKEDIGKIKRANTAKASANYRCRCQEPWDKLEVWRETEKETKIATLTIVK